MHIVTTLTDGDSDHVMVGRNGIFYDRDGNDWDATIVKIVESVSDLNAICRGAAGVLGRLWNASGDSSELGSSVDATVGCDLGPTDGRVHRGVVRPRGRRE